MKSDASTFSNGNQTVAITSGNDDVVVSSIAIPTTGKWAFKVNYDSGTAGLVGVITIDAAFQAGTGGVSAAHDQFYYALDSGNTYQNAGSGTVSGFSTLTAGTDDLEVFVDMDAGTIDFSKNGGSKEGSNSLTDTSRQYLFSLSSESGSAACAFTIDNDFTPSDTDFLPLNTVNLPEIEIGQEADDLATDHFNTVIWTGDGTTPRSITGFGFDPDMIWAKERSQSLSWSAYDSVRGAGNDKELIPDDTYAEGGGNQETYGFLSAFITDGFTATDGSGTPNYYFNQDTKPYIAYGWLAGSSGTVVAESGAGADGFNACTHFANQDAGFSIVKFTGRNSDISDGEETRVTHGLSAVPEFIIIKSRDTASNWAVPQIPDEDRHLVLNTTAAVSGSLYTGAQADTTSSYFVVGNNDVVNKDGDEFIAYCWHSVEGFSKFGSYTGNGATDGTFVYTGFEPAMVCVKASDDVQAWRIFDNARNPLNDVDLNLMVDSTGAEFESSAYNAMDFVSNGFKIRATTAADGGTNGSGTNYIFMAFSSGTGFKYATGN